MNSLCSEPQRDHIPPSLERLLSEFDTNSFKLEKQTFFDRLCKYLCYFSLMNEKNIL